MKVLHVIPTLSPRYGGPREAVLELCRALRATGMEVEICATDADGQGRLPVELGKRTLYEGAPCFFFRKDWSDPFYYSKSLRHWFDENVRHYDLVHIHDIFVHTTCAGASACRRWGVPYIVRPCGTLEPWCMSQKRLRKLVFWRLGLRRMVQQAIAIQYTTDQERELTESSLGLRNGIVVPNGVPETLLQHQRGHRFRKQVGIPGESPFLLALSRIHPKKGIDLLLKAFVELHGRGQLPGWHLVVAGDGEANYVRNLHGLARRTEAEPFVHFTGWLEGESKYDALSEATLFVLSSYQENFGIAVAEAMACATPVLISQHVGLAAEVIQAGAGWVTNIPDGLQQGLLEATKDPTELRNRGLAARALMRDRFTWRQVAETWVSRYKELAGANADGAIEVDQPKPVSRVSV